MSLTSYIKTNITEMRINMESLVGRSQNVAAIIERKKKNKKAFFISAGIIILAAVLLGAIYNYYINISAMLIASTEYKIDKGV